MWTCCRQSSLVSQQHLISYSNLAVPLRTRYNYLLNIFTWMIESHLKLNLFRFKVLLNLPHVVFFSRGPCLSGSKSQALILTYPSLILNIWSAPRKGFPSPPPSAIQTCPFSSLLPLPLLKPINFLPRLCNSFPTDSSLFSVVLFQFSRLYSNFFHSEQEPHQVILSIKHFNKIKPQIFNVAKEALRYLSSFSVFHYLIQLPHSMTFTLVALAIQTPLTQEGLLWQPRSCLPMKGSQYMYPTLFIH